MSAKFPRGVAGPFLARSLIAMDFSYLFRHFKPTGIEPAPGRCRTILPCDTGTVLSTCNTAKISYIDLAI